MESLKPDPQVQQRVQVTSFFCINDKKINITSKNITVFLINKEIYKDFMFLNVHRTKNKGLFAKKIRLQIFIFFLSPHMKQQSKLNYS